MKCPVNNECLFTAMQLIQRGETVKGIWGGLSAIQLRRALDNPSLIPKMRGQRSRSKNPPVFAIPPVPEPLEGYGPDVAAAVVDGFVEIRRIYPAAELLEGLEGRDEAAG